jgi:proteasome lid subunit RPN8/RPN11
MTLHIEQSAYEAITAHAEEGYPNEICGILLGKDAVGKRSVHAIMRIDNSFEADEQYHRFLITPEDMFKVERLARQQRLDILGVYHSHPDEEARPSDYDRDHAAWTAWAYIIVSVRSGCSKGIRAWKLREDRIACDEDDLVIAEELQEENNEHNNIPKESGSSRRIGR